MILCLEEWRNYDMIEIKGLTKYYGKSRGIIDLNLTIKKGEIFGFIGPNGAGKSTTIRLLLSFIYPSKGSALIDGLDCFKDSKRIKQRLGYVPSEVTYYDDMLVADLLLYSSRFYGKENTERMKDLSKRLGLDVNKKINDLSYGNKKKVAIVQALLHEPTVLILDEPTSGLDPLVQNTFFEILKEEKDKGTTVLFSSHILSEVQKVCDRIAILKDGRLRTVETIASLRKNKFRQVQIYYQKNVDVTNYETLPIKNLSVTNNTISFLYTGDIQVLLEQLSKDNDIDNISMEEPPLEDIFMHYYSKGDDMQ